MRFITLVITLSIMTAACKTAPTIIHQPVETKGVVEFFNDIPQGCESTSGIKQNVVKRVTSENELRRHYGLTFLVNFADNRTPSVYGTLYYQSEEKNLYCMALPDGRFARFQNSQIDEFRKNVIDQVCYPMDSCGR